MSDTEVLSTTYRPKIMVVDDDDQMRTVLCAHFRRTELVPIEMRDAVDAIESYDTFKPAVVLTDVAMPNVTGLDLLTSLKEKDKNAIVILMSGHGNEQVLFDALHGGASGFFEKPFDFDKLTSFVLNAVRQKREQPGDRLFSHHLTSETKQFEFGPTGVDIPPIVDQITLNLSHLVSDPEVVNLRIGIHEMIENAIEHGTLGISFAEKAESISDGTFAELIAARSGISENRQKRVRVHSRLDSGEFCVTVEDEGDGFEWRLLRDPGVESLQSYNGRGIILTKIYYDEVTYNEKGNAVTLTKFLQSASQAAPKVTAVS